MNRERIWELDALRGVCILGMVIIHLLYDLVELFGLIEWDYPPAVTFVQSWGGVAFLLISGVCATLGSRSVRRGLIVLGCGMVITAVTAGLYLLRFTDRSILIYFGVLHCLGVCMLLWYFFRQLPAWGLGALGAALTALGLYFRTLTVNTPYLIVLGLVYPGFVSSDYFPLLPNLGFFLLGAFLGRTIYRDKHSLLPHADTGNPLIRFFTFIGRNSLPVYMLHQPVLAALIGLAALALSML